MKQKKIRDEIVSSFKENYKKIIINLESVRFIDSEGIRTLAFCLQEIKHQNGEFKISNLQDQVKKVFELTKLLDYFMIYENEEETISSFH